MTDLREARHKMRALVEGRDGLAARLKRLQEQLANAGRSTRGKLVVEIEQLEKMIEASDAIIAQAGIQSAAASANFQAHRDEVARTIRERLQVAGDAATKLDNLIGDIAQTMDALDAALQDIVPILSPEMARRWPSSSAIAGALFQKGINRRFGIGDVYGGDKCGVADRFQREIAIPCQHEVARLAAAKREERDAA